MEFIKVKLNIENHLKQTVVELGKASLFLEYN